MKIHRIILPLLLAVCAGCASWSVETVPAAGFVGSVRVMPVSAMPVVLDSAVVHGDTLSGIAREVPRRHVALALSDISRIERWETDASNTLAVIGFVVGFAAFVFFKYLIPPST